MTGRTIETSPQVYARIAGVFYLLNILTGASALLFVSGRLVVLLIATASYIAVTLLFYELFEPVNRSLSLLAALFGLVGCTIAALNSFHLVPFNINSLVF